MFLRTTLRVRCTAASIYCQNVNARFLATQAEASKNLLSLNDQLDRAYAEALPYSSIPGPSALSLLLSGFPGGKFYEMNFQTIGKYYRKKYGDLIKFPGLFGKRDFIFSYNPDHYELIFRTEGAWPMRPGMETLEYFRTKLRKDIFNVHQGLINSQGEEWSQFRSVVNPVMMKPKNVKLYIPTIDEVATDFLQRIRKIRNPSTNQLPANFQNELNKWSLESIGVISLDTRLGLIADEINENAQTFIENIRTFFELLIQLEFGVSAWKIVATPKFTKLMNVLETLTNLSSQYIEEAKRKLEEKPNSARQDHELSVLEKLLKIDTDIAKVMAFDMIFAGVDTTSSAFVGVLYLLATNPEKQELLRKEISAVLPDKKSSFTVENMAKLPYLRACIKESQRIFSTISSNARSVGRNLVLDGYRIPKGTVIMVTLPDLLTEEKYFPNPTKFLPERWLRGDGAGSGCPSSARATHPFVYLPFGFGPRTCIGRRFAEMEIEILLGKLIRNFQISWEHPELKFKMTTLNVPDGKLMFTLNELAY